MNKKARNIGLGCGCGCLSIGVLIVGILFVVALVYGGSISNFYALVVDPATLTYEGKKVSDIAKEQRLSGTKKNIAPRTDGTYRNKNYGLGLRFNKEFGQYTIGSGDAELVLLSDEKKRLKFKVNACGQSIYDLIDDRGKHWAFCSVGSDRKSLMLNDNGRLASFEFKSDPKEPKKKRK